MKVLLFTHISDIDSMGNVILAKLAFKEVEYVLCEGYNLQKEIAKYYENKSIYNYDKIFVTDLWLQEPFLSKIANDKKLKDKFFVFDHHKSSLGENKNKYFFVTLKISNELGLCCGTSLFYEYLVNNNFLNKSILIDEFVELTRRYDTWEWKTKYNDEMAHELTLLFDSVGCEGFIQLISQKISEQKEKKFTFNEVEEMLIANKINQVQDKLNDYTKNVFYKEILGKKAGIIFIDYEYRNDLAEYLREKSFDMDFVMLVAMDKSSISYRSINPEVDVRLIAEAMGGKGHDKAAASPISEKQKNEIIQILSNKF